MIGGGTPSTVVGLEFTLMSCITTDDGKIIIINTLPLLLSKQQNHYMCNKYCQKLSEFSCFHKPLHCIIHIN